MVPLARSYVCDHRSLKIKLKTPLPDLTHVWRGMSLTRPSSPSDLQPRPTAPDIFREFTHWMIYFRQYMTDVTP